LAIEELLTIEGFIEEVIPDGRFAFRLDDAHKIIAYTAGKMRKFRIRSVEGDRVRLEMTPYDLTKGRIVLRERTPGQAGPANRRNNFRNRQVRPRPPIEDNMHRSNKGGHSFPMTEIFADDHAGRRAAADQNGHGELATEVLRLLVAAMVD
jgi:translation initiation factor IF-1